VGVGGGSIHKNGMFTRSSRFVLASKVISLFRQSRRVYGYGYGWMGNEREHLKRQWGGE